MNILQHARLNHLSLPTTNAAETAAFFEQYLGCEIVTRGTHYLLKHRDFDIVLEQCVDEAPTWPTNFHFGFEVETLAEVQALYQAFVDGGVQMETGVFNNTRGSRFFCRVPGGVMIEINTREDRQNGTWEKLF